MSFWHVHNPPPWRPKEGVYFNVPEGKYHSCPYVSKSRLWKLHNALYLTYDAEELKRLVMAERPETDALLMGRITDDLLFAGREETLKRYQVGPTDKRGTKAWKEAEAKAPEGVTLVREKVLKQAENIAASIARHPIASELLCQGVGHSQVSVIARDPNTGLMCKGRIDRHTAYEGFSTHVDLKTCRSLKWFRKDAEDYGYWIQSRFYLRLCQRIDVLKGQPPANRRFIFAVAENSESAEFPGYHPVQCFEYDQQSMDSAERMTDTLLEQWRVLFHENRHPGEAARINPIYISEHAEKQLEPTA